MSEAPLKVGDTVRLQLTSLAAGGEAVGRHQSMAVFAIWGCPGDEADVEITEVRPSFARGLVREVISPSPDRIQPPCPHFGDCGGCQLQHIAYRAQLRHKTAIVADALARIAKLAKVDVGRPWGMNHPWHYRGRAEYHARLDASGALALGFARYHSHDLVPLQECRLQHPLSEQVRTSLLALMPSLAQGAAERAALLGVETLVSYADKEAVATLVCDGRPPFLSAVAEGLMTGVPGLVGVGAARQRGAGAVHRSPSALLAGRLHLTERLADDEYRFSADSFFQVNPAQAARVRSLVLEWAGVTGSDAVIDCYSGVGTFLLPLARAAASAAGIESQEAALTDARANLRHWRVRKVTLYRGQVESVLPRLAGRDRHADIVVLDPPRKGCGPVVCEAATRLRPRRIILVSCHPATLARDLKQLAELGYPPRRLQVVDMFPHTWHVETVAVCERGR